MNEPDFARPDHAARSLQRWYLAGLRTGESARWETPGGRWVAITLGHGASAGKAIVADSRGRCEAVDSFEDALALAAAWRA